MWKKTFIFLVGLLLFTQKAEADYRKVLDLTKDPELVYGAKRGLELLGIFLTELQ